MLTADYAVLSISLTDRCELPDVAELKKALGNYWLNTSHFLKLNDMTIKIVPNIWCSPEGSPNVKGKKQLPFVLQVPDISLGFNFEENGITLRIHPPLKNLFDGLLSSWETKFKTLEKKINALRQTGKDRKSEHLKVIITMAVLMCINLSQSFIQVCETERQRLSKDYPSDAVSSYQTILRVCSGIFCNHY